MNPHQATPGGAPWMGGASGHEFDPQQEQVIAQLASRMRWWGIISVLMGGLVCVAILGMGVVASTMVFAHNASIGVMLVVGSVVLTLPFLFGNVIAGTIYLGAAGRFRAVVETRGNDIPLTLEAVQRMGRAFRLEFVMQILAYVVGFIAAVVGVIVMSTFIAAMGGALQ